MKFFLLFCLVSATVAYRAELRQRLLMDVYHSYWGLIHDGQRQNAMLSKIDDNQNEFNERVEKSLLAAIPLFFAQISFKLDQLNLNINEIRVPLPILNEFARSTFRPTSPWEAYTTSSPSEPEITDFPVEESTTGFPEWPQEETEATDYPDNTDSTEAPHTKGYPYPWPQRTTRYPYPYPTATTEEQYPNPTTVDPEDYNDEIQKYLKAIFEKKGQLSNKQ